MSENTISDDGNTEQYPYAERVGGVDIPFDTRPAHEPGEDYDWSEWEVEIPEELLENNTVSVSLTVRVNGQRTTIGGSGNIAGTYTLRKEDAE